MAFAIFSPLSISITYGIWIIAALLTFYVLCLKRFQTFKSTPLDAPLLAFTFVSALSVITSIDFKASLKEYRSLGLIIIFYLFSQTLNNEKRIDRFLNILIVFSTIAGAYGVFQYITGKDFLGHYLDRSTGFFSLYLTFAEYMVMILCLCLGQIVYKLSLKKRLFLSASVVFMLGGLILSFSRGPWLGFMVAIVFLAFFRSWKLFIILMIGAVLLFFLFYFSNLGKISMLVRSIVTLNGGEGSVAQMYLQSNLERLAMWRSGFHILAENPRFILTGLGMHALENLYPEYREEGTVHENLWHLHSNFMHILVTRGVLGLTAFFCIFGIFFSRCYKYFIKSSHSQEKGILLGILAGVIGFLVSGLTEYSWGDTEVLMLLYCLMGISVVLGRGSEELTINSKSFKK
jgi:putative inorganic carbon (HCO3(-)) transporter